MATASCQWDYMVDGEFARLMAVGASSSGTKEHSPDVPTGDRAAVLPPFQGTATRLLVHGQRPLFSRVLVPPFVPEPRIPLRIVVIEPFILQLDPVRMSRSPCPIVNTLCLALLWREGCPFTSLGFSATRPFAGNSATDLPPRSGKRSLAVRAVVGHVNRRASARCTEQPPHWMN